MCGIAGIFNKSSPVDPSHIKAMADLLRHRGPDDEGYIGVDLQQKIVHALVGKDSAVSGRSIDDFSGKARLFLGHRRLSIIDVSPAGHQPMSDWGQNVWLVFNGEIYNYIELRAELEKKGHKFHTSSDTEVLIYSYLEWGMDCLAKFNGMWSFVIYDKRKDLLFGSRDRFGVKPMYYYLKNGWFLFASEMKAIVQLPFVEKRINERAAFQYLVHQMNNPDECMFGGIEELKPSHAFTFDLASGEFKTWAYYSLETNDKWESFKEKRFEEINERVRGLVFNAVRLRLRSDVAVGSCLSGGMDSSSIVCIVNDYLKKEAIGAVGDRQKVFTACYPGDSIDESKWAQIVVDATKTTWHKTFPDAASLLDDLDDLVYYQDVPFGSTSIYAQYRVMKIAKENGVKVLLDGQGGDELFTGYADYFANFAFDLIKHAEIKRLFLESRNLRYTPINNKVIAFFAYYFIWKSLFAELKHHAMRYLGKDFIRSNKCRNPNSEQTSFMSLNKMLAHTMNHHLPELLWYEDRNSMRFSIESRTPFSDDIDLIDYTFSVPSIYKIHDGWNKFLLRKAVAGVVPDAIVRRTDKIGFATPEYNWILEKKDEILSRMKSEGLDYFIDYDSIAKDWDGLVAGQQKTGITTIWRYINFALWKKRFAL
ncbi:MAG TPA: asparagine synthase (glutamine-hydrolyzing) [Chitinivibrionales bacterium]|nr:asparagine synthase (glutamine-hydrolyzing) [Chitinivibrionales bacterium]